MSGTTSAPRPGFNGDTAKALASIKAKTLILTGTKDLLNPEFEPQEAARTSATCASRPSAPAPSPAMPPVRPSRPTSISSIARFRSFSIW